LLAARTTAKSAALKIVFSPLVFWAYLQRAIEQRDLFEGRRRRGNEAVKEDALR